MKRFNTLAPYLVPVLILGTPFYLQRLWLDLAWIQTNELRGFVMTTIVFCGFAAFCFLKASE